MKRDKKGIKEKLVKWINRIVSKDKKKKKIRNKDNHSKNVILQNYH